MNSGTKRYLFALLAAFAMAATLAAPTVSAQAATSTAAPAAKAAAPYKIKAFKPRKGDNARLVKNWKKWKKHGYVAYTTKVDLLCFCLDKPPVITKVSGKRVTSVRQQGKKRELARKGYEMDRLFRQLRRAYKQADQVTVKYRAGVPVRIYVDRDRRLADDEYTLTVKVRNVAIKGPVAN